MEAGSGSSRGTRLVHEGPDELLIKRDSVPDREITLPIQEGAQHTHSLSSPLPDLVDVMRPGELCI